MTGYKNRIIDMGVQMSDFDFSDSDRAAPRRERKRPPDTPFAIGFQATCGVVAAIVALNILIGGVLLILGVIAHANR